MNDKSDDCKSYCTGLTYSNKYSFNFVY